MIILIKLSLILLYGKLEIYYLNLGRVEKSKMKKCTLNILIFLSKSPYHLTALAPIFSY